MGPLWHGQTPLCPHCAGLIPAFDLDSGREGSGSDGSLCPGILVVRWWPEQQGTLWLRGPGSEGAPKRGDLGQPCQGTGTRQLGPPRMGRTHPGPWGEGESTADTAAPGRGSAHCPVQLQHELGGCVSTGGCARSQGSRGRVLSTGSPACWSDGSRGAWAVAEVWKEARAGHAGGKSRPWGLQV